MEKKKSESWDIRLVSAREQMLVFWYPKPEEVTEGVGKEDKLQHFLCGESKNAYDSLLLTGINVKN